VGITRNDNIFVSPIVKTKGSKLFNNKFHVLNTKLYSYRI
jgi:hypothetical protein